MNKMCGVSTLYYRLFANAGNSFQQWCASCLKTIFKGHDSI